jgi:membrane fusion protein (multidrug efflux system)
MELNAFRSAATRRAIRPTIMRLPALLLAAATFSAVLSACSDGRSQTSGKGGPGAMAMPVTVVEAQLQRVPITVEAVGTAEGSKEVEVRARVSGVLMRQLYKEGETVKAGAPMFAIDRAAIEIAQSQARAQLAQDRANLERAEREAARLKPLVGEKAISQKEYDDATSALKTAQAAVLASQARLRDAELNLSYTNVTAPITGVSGRAQQSVGSLIAANGETSLLTTINVTDPIWVRFALSDSEALKLRRANGKNEARLLLADGSTYELPGKINFLASSVDAKTGTVSMRAEFPNPKRLLLPGQFVRVQVTTGTREAFLVPQAAVMQGDEGRVAFTASADNKVAPRPVETAGWYGKDWVVTGGLKAGDKVIVDNLMKLRPGAPVAPHAPGQGPGAATTGGVADAPKGDGAAAKK